MPSHMAVGFVFGLHLGLNQPNLNNPVSVTYSGELGIVGGAMVENLDTIIAASEAEVTVSCCNGIPPSKCGNTDSQTYIPCATACGENRASKCIFFLKSFYWKYNQLCIQDLLTWVSVMLIAAPVRQGGTLISTHPSGKYHIAQGFALRSWRRIKSAACIHTTSTRQDSRKSAVSLESSSSVVSLILQLSKNKKSVSFMIFYVYWTDFQSGCM